ncbi:MAG: bifunctional folylpolyglutamate synthase/dihydrofolate synthase [Nitrospirae bacterium]|nr:MAG: bifunctional folylpolyglutamate synthase/dihydrofolate synthase [Nitrospirota bacterium]
MSYQGTIEYLYGLQKFGMKFGLDNITRLLAAAGDPHKAFRSVHIAGTNGKGSTAAMIDSILRTGGFRTGLFTSPHLVSFTERIRINAQEIPEAEVVSLADEVRALAEDGLDDDLCPTFFEVVTAMAFIWFRRQKVDWAVIETGLGGRLDATNIIMPEVSVITKIGHDHAEFLGTTLEEIAAEKAGIIKQAVPVVTADQTPGVLQVLKQKAAAKQAPLSVFMKDFSSELLTASPGRTTFRYTGSRVFEQISVPLSGAHQMTNASLATRTAELLSARFPEMSLDIQRGLADVSWPGRLEMVSDAPPILIDGAHNPQAAEALAVYLRGLLAKDYERIIGIFGVMGDKDISGILRPLIPLASEIIFTAPAYGRAASPERLSQEAAQAGKQVRTAPTVAGALGLARGLYQPGDLIVVTGSFYTIGEAREALGCKGILTRLRE